VWSPTRGACCASATGDRSPVAAQRPLPQKTGPGNPSAAPDYVRVHLREGGWVEGYRQTSTTDDARVLLLDTVAVREAGGAARIPSPMDSFIPACETKRIDALDAPSNRGA
jgi:hypothetical protein